MQDESEQSRIIAEVQQLAVRLNELIVVDKDRRVFGASSHLYWTGTTRTEEELVEFEQSYSVRLPADYRLFLKSVSDGGAGPHYGMVKLWGCTDECNLNLSFPWTKAAFLEEPSYVGLKPEDCEAEPPDETLLRWGVPGSIKLSEEGCGYFSFLVVNGPAYGTVWNYWLPADCGLIPTHMSFAGWYRNWIERCLVRISKDPLVDRVEVGMNRDELIQIFGSIPKESAGKPNSPEHMLTFTDVAALFFLSGDQVSRIARIHV